MYLHLHVFHCSYLNLNMNIFLKTFENVEYVFHFQTNFDLHIVLNMFLMIQHYVKILYLTLTYIRLFNIVFKIYIFFIMKFFLQ